MGCRRGERESEERDRASERASEREREKGERFRKSFREAGHGVRFDGVLDGYRPEPGWGLGGGDRIVFFRQGPLFSSGKAAAVAGARGARARREAGVGDGERLGGGRSAVRR